MSGGVAAPPGRVRIKGKTPSVVRFFIISVAYTLVWIIVSSELGYYSRLYGPQVLLQLNLAYYLPSIPVLIAMGQLERLLDRALGPTAAMAVRLLLGLLGCCALSAAFPFLPSRLAVLLGATVAVGCVSAVAFSTSYQLVAWFRSADTIALGIGCVGSGPLALALQLGLHIGPIPKRWQWIALFELSAACVAAGAACALSLLWQYWPILSGEASEQRAPLLDAETGGVDDDEAEERAAQQLLLAPGMSTNLLIADPFQLPWGVAPGSLMPHIEAQLRSGEALRRAASAESDLSFADWRRRQRAMEREEAAAAGAASTPGGGAAAAAAAPAPHPPGSAPPGGHRPPRAPGGALPLQPPPPRTAPVALQRLPGAAAQMRGHLAAAGRADAAAGLSASLPSAGGMEALALAAGLGRDPAPGGGSDDDGEAAVGARQCAAVLTKAIAAEASALGGGGAAAFAAPPVGPRGGSDGEGSQGSDSPRRYDCDAPRSESSESLPSLGRAGDGGGSGGGRPVADSDRAWPTLPSALAAPSDSPGGSPSKSRLRRSAPGGAGGVQPSPFSSTAALSGGSRESLTDPKGRYLGGPASPSKKARPGGGMGATAAEAAAAAAAEALAPGESWGKVTWHVFTASWATYVGTFVAATLVNLIFPFFTYVPSSGWLGEMLPQVLFYSRIFADIAGRLMPRRKALALSSPNALLALAVAELALSGAFFAYIQAPPQLQRDSVAVLLIVVIWALGGYVNTNSYILAPSSVAPRYATKASALMALCHQMSHIVGLALAVVVALAIYGDISGDL